MINVFQPSFGLEEISAAARVINSEWIGKGPKVAEFEAAWAAHIGVKPENVVSVSCATEGLFQIAELLLESRDEVIIPSIHFIGAANAVISSGASPIFCDVDRHTLNPTLGHIQGAESFLGLAKSVILLHYGGVAQELDTIREWCDSKRLWLIEDAANAQATAYKGKAAGTWGHFGVWSFDAMKIMSTGDGGMIYCEDADHAKELRKRLYLGQDTVSGLASKDRQWWKVESSYPGRRAVMNDLAAGIGLEQLKKLGGFVDRRREISKLYDVLLASPGYESYKAANDAKWLYDGSSSHYFYWVQTPRRNELAHYLREQGIYTTFRYYPLHWTFKTGQSLPGAEYAAENTLLLPLHQGLSDNDVNYVCEKVRGFYR